MKTCPQETTFLVIQLEVGLFVHASIITVQQLTLRLLPLHLKTRCCPFRPAVARPTKGHEAAAVAASKAAAAVVQHARQQRSSRHDSSRCQGAGPAAAGQVAGAGAAVGPSATAGGNLKMPLHRRLYIICQQKEPCTAAGLHMHGFTAFGALVGGLCVLLAICPPVAASEVS